MNFGRSRSRTFLYHWAIAWQKLGRRTSGQEVTRIWILDGHKEKGSRPGVSKRALLGAIIHASSESIETKLRRQQWALNFLEVERRIY